MFNRGFFLAKYELFAQKTDERIPRPAILILTTFKGTVSQEKFCFKKVLLSSGRHQLACVPGPIGMRVGPVGMHARANWHACQGQLACVLGPIGMCAWTNWHACRGQLACVPGPIGMRAGANWHAAGANWHACWGQIRSFNKQDLTSEGAILKLFSLLTDSFIQNNFIERK